MIAGPELGLAVDLPPIGVVIGADPSADVVLTDEAVSGRHCTVAPAADGFEVRDLGSRNGTLLDGVALSQAVVGNLQFALGDYSPALSSQEQALKEGTMNAMQNIPASPLASVIAAASPSAYQAMTAPVPGANPEAPNMLAGLDNLMLGGLIESPLARGLMRVNAPNMKAAAPARLRGKLFDPQGESGPTFYSQARAVVEDPRTQATQTGEAWLKFMTDPNRGVKAEELKWTGLGDYLKSKGGQRVTREEIQSHLDANEIQINEVTKGAGSREQEWQLRYKDGSGRRPCVVNLYRF